MCGRVLVAGSDTLLGAAIIRALLRGKAQDCVVLEDHGVDWTDAHAAEAWFGTHKPDYVFDAAGASGGIGKNRRLPATLMWNNLALVTNLLATANRHRVKKLVYLASSCSYPRAARQPMVESDILTGPLEPTSEPYAIAKIAGMKLCSAYRVEHGARFVTAIPANAFGPGDDYSVEDSHVVGALIRRAHEATVRGSAALSVWGSGEAIRDFVFADDAAEAFLIVMREYDDPGPINVGDGDGVRVAELAQKIASVVGFRGDIVFDATKPEGAPVKRLDATAIRKLGWAPRTSLEEALTKTYTSFLETLYGAR
jgi:GDP-L-fucose synthase